MRTHFIMVFAENMHLVSTDHEAEMGNLPDNILTLSVYAATTESASTDATQLLTQESEKEVEKLRQLPEWLSRLGNNALSLALKIGVCILLYIIIRKVLGKLLKLLDEYLSRRNVAPTVRHFASSLIYVSVLGFTIVTMIVQLNIVQASSIAALLAAAGVGVSLAVQGVLSNFTGGLLLMILKPFKEGDYIIVSSENIEGTVQRIEFYYTTIYTPDRCTMVIPNSTLTNKSVTNALSGGLKRLTITIGIAYEADADKAMTILEQLMDAEPRIHKENRRTFINEMADSAVVVGMRCLCSIQDYMDLKWDMEARIKQAFDQEGIEIPFNQLDVHIRND